MGRRQVTDPGERQRRQHAPAFRPRSGRWGGVGRGRAALPPRAPAPAAGSPPTCRAARTPSACRSWRTRSSKSVVDPGFDFGSAEVRVLGEDILSSVCVFLLFSVPGVVRVSATSRRALRRRSFSTSTCSAEALGGGHSGSAPPPAAASRASRHSATSEVGSPFPAQQRPALRSSPCPARRTRSKMGGLVLGRRTFAASASGGGVALGQAIIMGVCRSGTQLLWPLFDVVRPRLGGGCWPSGDVSTSARQTGMPSSSGRTRRGRRLRPSGSAGVLRPRRRRGYRDHRPSRDAPPTGPGGRNHNALYRRSSTASIASRPGSSSTPQCVRRGSWKVMDHSGARTRRRYSVQHFSSLRCHST